MLHKESFGPMAMAGVIKLQINKGFGFDIKNLVNGGLKPPLTNNYEIELFYHPPG